MQSATNSLLLALGVLGTLSLASPIVSQEDEEIDEFSTFNDTDNDHLITKFNEVLNSTLAMSNDSMNSELLPFYIVVKKRSILNNFTEGEEELFLTNNTDENSSKVWISDGLKNKEEQELFSANNSFTDNYPIKQLEKARFNDNDTSTRTISKTRPGETYSESEVEDFLDENFLDEDFLDNSTWNEVESVPNNNITNMGISNSDYDILYDHREPDRVEIDQFNSKEPLIQYFPQDLLSGYFMSDFVVKRSVENLTSTTEKHLELDTDFELIINERSVNDKQNKLEPDNTTSNSEYQTTVIEMMLLPGLLGMDYFIGFETLGNATSIDTNLEPSTIVANNTELRKNESFTSHLQKRSVGSENEMITQNVTKTNENVDFNVFEGDLLNTTGVNKVKTIPVENYHKTPSQEEIFQYLINYLSMSPKRIFK